MDFSDALHALKRGSLVARDGWNGRGMFLYLVAGSEFTVNRPPLLGIYPEGTRVRYHAHIDMRTATGDCVPWLASQADMLAEDWRLVHASDPDVYYDEAGLSYFPVKKATPTYMRLWMPGANVDGVRFGPGEQPEIGGRIAINPMDPSDRWYISPAHFDQHYVEDDA